MTNANTIQIIVHDLLKVCVLIGLRSIDSPYSLIAATRVLVRYVRHVLSRRADTRYRKAKSILLVVVGC